MRGVRADGLEQSDAVVNVQPGRAEGGDRAVVAQRNAIKLLPVGPGLAHALMLRDGELRRRKR